MAPFYLSLFTCHPSPFTFHLFLIPVIIVAAAARTAATTTLLEIYVAGKAMKTICQRQTRFYSHYLYLRLHIFLFHISFEIILFIFCPADCSILSPIILLNHNFLISVDITPLGIRLCVQLYAIDSVPCGVAGIEI